MIDDSDKPFIERMDNRFAYAWGTLNAPHNWPKLTQEQEHRRERLMSSSRRPSASYVPWR